MRKSLVLMAAVLSLAGVNGVMAADEQPQKPAKMRKVDSDGDGKVSKDEYVAAAAVRFSKLDSDQDGYLTRQEMRAARKKGKEE